MTGYKFVMFRLRASKTKAVVVREAKIDERVKRIRSNSGERIGQKLSRRLGRLDFANEPSACATACATQPFVIGYNHLVPIPFDAIPTVGTAKSDLPDNKLCANGVWFDRSLVF